MGSKENIKENLENIKSMLASGSLNKINRDVLELTERISRTPDLDDKKSITSDLRRISASIERLHKNIDSALQATQDWLEYNIYTLVEQALQKILDNKNNKK